MIQTIDDTIAAVATPLGEGGLGVVRLSGPEAVAAADKIFRGSRPLSEASSHTLHHGRLWRDGRVLDEAVAAVFKAPRSYTGEDVVEISCHGGVFLMKEVLSLCLGAGARLAAPGEFTRRAFTNGKMDLAQAEAVADLIAAQGEAQRRLSVEQLEGRLSRCVGDMRRGLVDLLAHLEANLDFVDDEVPDLDRASLTKQIEGLRAQVARLLATASRGKLLREGLRVTLVGKPNVGKSSLFNALLQADRAIVTPVPGTTRDTLEETFMADGVPVVLTDTAGLRDGAEPVETEGIARARKALDRADVALWVIDATAPMTEEDRAVGRALQGRAVVVALNKTDAAPQAGLPKDVAPKEWARTSAATGAGLDDLRRALLRATARTSASAEEARTAAGAAAALEAGAVPTVANARHEALLKEAAAALDEAARAAPQEGEEVLAVPLRAALDALSRITGENVNEDILDAIFARFCIGK